MVTNLIKNRGTREPDGKSRADRLLDYIFPPACVCCGALVYPDSPQDCFCESCMRKLEAATVPRYREVELEGKRIPVLTAVEFSPLRGCPCRALVLRMKNLRSSRAAYFAARRLYDVLHMLPLCEDTVIAYVPRSRSGKRRYGFDQMEIVARKLSHMTGMGVLPCLKNTSGSIQKGLSAADRIRAAKNKFAVRRSCAERLRGANVLLIDDVCTTGASVCACTRALFDAGCAHVFPLCLADASRDRL